MTTPCPHCSTVIEIDPATHAALAGQSHFACPVCQGAVPVPAIIKPRLQLHPALGIHASAPPPTAYPRRKPTSSNPSRKLLIFGSAVLLVLGGLGFFLASRNGTIFNSEQRITNEIIHNSYFQNLIASGGTTKSDLEKFAVVRPCGEGFWALSADLLTWHEAQKLAARSGGKIFEVGGTPTCWTEILGLVKSKFPILHDCSVWVSEGNQASVRRLGLTSNPDSPTDTTVESRHRVLLHWNPSKPVDNSLPWVYEEVPPPDRDGWITLFDGTHLHGVSRDGVRKRSELIGAQDGHFWLESRGLYFGVNARNVCLRVVAKKISGQNFCLNCRAGGGVTYGAWSNGSFGVDFGIGMQSNSGWRDLRSVPGIRSPDDFFETEFIVRDHTLTLNVDGRRLASIEDKTDNQAGSVGLYAVKGRSLFSKVQVKILD